MVVSISLNKTSKPSYDTEAEAGDGDNLISETVNLHQLEMDQLQVGRSFKGKKGDQ